VMACTLGESPSDPLHRRLRRLCCLRCRFDCYRVERTSSRAGVSPAVVPAPFHGALVRQLRRLPPVGGSHSYRVARRPCGRPALSELGVKVSLHPAQALRTPLLEETRFRNGKSLAMKPVMALG